MLPGIHIFIELQNCTVTTDESIVLKLAEEAYTWFMQCSKMPHKPKWGQFWKN